MLSDFIQFVRVYFHITILFSYVIKYKIILFYFNKRVITITRVLISYIGLLFEQTFHEYTDSK